VSAFLGSHESNDNLKQYIRARSCPPRIPHYKRVECDNSL